MLDRTTPPPVRPFDFRPLPPERVERLRNGVTLHTVLGGTQAVGQMTVLLPGGAFSSPVLSSMASRLYSEGAGQFSGADIADSLDFAGATLQPHSSALFTGLSSIVLSHRLADILPIIGAMIQEPRFSSESLENIRRTMLAGLRVEHSKVLFRAVSEFRRLVYGKNHPQTHVNSEEELDAVTTASLHNFQKRLVKPDGIHVYLSGGFGEPTVDAVKQFLSGLAAISPQTEGFTAEDHPLCPEDPQTVFIPAPGAVQTAICAGMPALPRRDPGFIRLRLAVMALGGYFGSRLMSNIREEKGLTYHIDAYVSAVFDASAVTIQAQCKSGNIDRVIDEIRKELRLLAENPPSGPELERLKLNAMTTLVETLDSPMTIANYRQLEVVTGTPADYFDAQQREIAALTPDTIAETAAAHLDPSSLRIAVSGPDAR